MALQEEPPPMSPAPRKAIWVLHVGLLAGAYFLTAKAGLSFGFLKGNVTAIWPPTGVALVALALGGRRLWPGIFIGALLVNGFSEVPLAAAFGMAAGNTLEALTGAWLLGRAGFDPSFRRLRDVVLFVGCGAVLSTVVSASIGVASLWLNGVVGPSLAWETMRTWWIGDATGNLVVAPLLLTLIAGHKVTVRGASRLEALALGTSIIVVSIVVFGRASGRPYVLFPLLVWAAIRFARPGATIATLMVSVIAVMRTAAGLGPFATGFGTEALSVLDSFVAIVAITGLVLASVVAERDRAQDELRDINEDLGKSVREQTEELRIDRERLSEAQRLAKMGSWEWDIVNNHVAWSDQLYRIFGLHPSDFEATYESYLTRIHPSDRMLAERTIGKAYQEVIPFDFEHRVILPGGEVRWIHSNGQVVAGSDGNAVKMSGTALDVTERKRAEEALAYQAGHDMLTNLPNRMLFLDRLSRAMVQRKNDSSFVSVLFLDIDHFKWLNDSLGHAAGDRLLVEVAERLQSCVRPGDTIGRFGGDEFVVLCRDLSDASEATAIARRFAKSISIPVILDGTEIRPTVSIGVAVSAHNDVSAESLVRDADAAMYRAKELGRDRCEIFDSEMRTQATNRLAGTQALRRAIEEGELTVHYQPEIDIATNRVIGVEALVRWNDPERGLVMPDDFITRAEETSLILPIGAAVLKEACNQMADWRRLGVFPPDASVSVNLSARQLAMPGLLDLVRESLQTSGLPAEALCLEITESFFIDDAEPFVATLRDLKDLGTRVAVDDFGTGYSSLRYLKRFPVDVLKIDRSFVDGVAQEDRDRTIVSSILGLADAFGLTTVAEGVETVEQLEALRAMGCKIGQGFLWSQPLTATDTVEWMAARAVPATTLVVEPKPLRRGTIRPAIEQRPEPSQQVQ